MATTYDYWIQDTSNLWIEVDSIGASATKTIYLKKEAGYSANGANTFRFFDDFTGSIGDNWSTQGTTWSFANDRLQCAGSANAWKYCYTTTFTISPPFIIENKVYDNDPYATINGTAGTLFGFDGSADAEEGMIDFGGTRLLATNGVKICDLTTPALPDTGIYKVVIPSNTSVTSWLPNGNDYTRSTSVNIRDSMSIGFIEYYGSKTPKWDWVFVRKYAATEPTITVTDMTTYYKIDIENNIASGLTNYEVKIDASDIGGLSTVTDSLNIQDEDFAPAVSYNATFFGCNF